MAGKKLSVDLTMNSQGFKQGSNEVIAQTNKLTSSTRDYIAQAGSLRKQFLEARREAQNLAAQYNDLSKAEKQSDIGKEIRENMQLAIERAGELQDVMGDTQEAIRNAASDTRGWDGLKEGLDAVGDAGIAIMSTMAAMTGEQKDLNKAIAAYMAIEKGLSTVIKVVNMLQAQSKVMKAIDLVQTKALAVAQGLQTKQTWLAVAAQKAFNIAANANPYVLLATAIGTVVGALALFCGGADDAEEESEELARKQEELAEKAKQARDTAVSAGSKYLETAEKLSALREQYISTNNELEKTEILKDAAEEFKNLGLKCDGVNEAEKLLVSQGNKVIEMLNLQGEAAAISALKMEAYQNSMKMLLENGYDFKSAAVLARSNEKVVGYNELLQDRRAQISNIAKTLPKASSGGKSGGRSGGTHTEIKTQVLDIPVQLRPEFDGKYRGSSIKGLKAQISYLDNQIEEATDNFTREKLYKRKEKLEKELKTVLDLSDGTIDFKLPEIHFDNDNDKAWYKVRKEFKGKYQEQADALFDSFQDGEMDETTFETQIEGLKNLQEAIDDINADGLNKIGDGFSSLGSAIGQFGSDSAKAAGQVLGATGQLFAAIGQVLAIGGSKALADALSMPFPANIGAIGTVVGLIATVVAQVASLSSMKFAGGGIVPGGSYSGDKVLSALNSGEGVLTRQGVDNLGKLYNNINSPTIISGTQKVEFVIKGKNLVGTMGNYDKQKNKII